MSVDTFIRGFGHKELSIEHPIYKKSAKAYRFAMGETIKELEQSIEGLYHNLNTLD